MATTRDIGFQILASRLIDFIEERKASTQEELASFIIECFSFVAGGATFRYYLSKLIEECKRKHSQTKMVAYLKEAIEFRHEKVGPMSKEETKEFQLKVKKMIEETRISDTIKNKGW